MRKDRNVQHSCSKVGTFKTITSAPLKILDRNVREKVSAFTCMEVEKVLKHFVCMVMTEGS